MRKKCASSWSFSNIYSTMHGSENVKFCTVFCCPKITESHPVCSMEVMLVFVLFCVDDALHFA
jgi:hypothetical protein